VKFGAVGAASLATDGFPGCKGVGVLGNDMFDLVLIWNWCNGGVVWMNEVSEKK
jgi:hypothetical protein